MLKKDDNETAGSRAGIPQTDHNRKRDPFVILIALLIWVADLYLVYEILRTMGWSGLSGISTFSTIVTSILMQAFPFMLIGVLVSSALHVFVPDGWLIKIFPTKYGLGFITAMFAGLFFPVCECAIVPVMTRLVKKGVSPAIAITFMLSAPIINPIVMVSTLYAFPGQPEVMVYRVCFGLGIAVLIGLALMITGGARDAILLPQNCADDACDCCCGHQDADLPVKLADKLKALFVHAGEEFFGVGKYLVIGAALTSLVRVLTPEDAFKSLGAQNALSLLLMMVAAFLFSACSTSDAFIARSFMNQISMGAIMGFLVFGPMMDVKNILMLLASFKPGFVLKLTFLIFALNFVVLYFFAFLLL